MAAKTAKKKTSVINIKPKTAKVAKLAVKANFVPQKTVSAPKNKVVKAIAKKSVPLGKSVAKKAPTPKTVIKKPVKKIGGIAVNEQSIAKTPPKKSATASQKNKPIKTSAVKKNPPTQQTKKTQSAKKSANINKKIPIKPAQKILIKAKAQSSKEKTPLKTPVSKSESKTSKTAANKKSATTKKSSSVKPTAENKPTATAVPNGVAKSKEKSSQSKAVSKTLTVKASKTSKSESAFSDFPAKTRGKSRHIRPSESIAFTLDDLDAYLERRENGTPISMSKEIAISKHKKTQLDVVVKPQPKVEPLKPTSTSRKPLAPASIFDILGFNPVEAPSREKLEEKDIPRKWKKYYNQLIELRKHHSSGVEKRAEEVMKRSAKEDSGDLSSYGQHLADAGSESFERDMTYNILSNEKEILAEIDEAIKRIKNGTYGICEVTGQPIPESRLDAIPFARYSKEGQERKELEIKRIKASQRNVYDIPENATGGEDDSGA